MQVDLLDKLPKVVEIEKIRTKSSEARVQKVKIQYDFLHKYCKTYKLHGYGKKKCKSLHSKLNEAQEVREEGQHDQ